MDLYNKARLHTRSERAKTNSRIGSALNGIMPRTADLMFDLSRNNDEYRLDSSRRAYVKAIELVSDLLGRFSLPIRPRLEYRGLVKNSMDNGVINNGLVRVGATITTLMGHKASIDIPVLIRNKKLLEPAIFFYGDAPYVMCAPAFEELIKLGTLEKAVQPRRMYQPPLLELAEADNMPKVPITNLEHMFSPGIRNPWTFRRHSSKKIALQIDKLDAQAIASPGLEEVSVEGTITIDGEEHHFMLKCQLDLCDYFIDGEKVTDLELLDVLEDYIYENVGMKLDPHAKETQIINITKQARRKTAQGGWDNDGGEIAVTEWAKSPDGKYFVIHFSDGVKLYTDGSSILNSEDVEDETEPYELALMGVSEATMPMRPMTDEEISDLEMNTGMSIQAQHKGKPRERTNIDTPVEWPEIWKADIPDHMLDPAERSMEGLITAGDKITLQKDTQVRERGGGHLVLPSGEQGIVLRDMEGDGLMLYICFKEMGLTAMVPARMCKGASVSVDQVCHEVREMLREGYKEIDIKDAIQRRYPEQATEALEGLNN